MDREDQYVFRHYPSYLWNALYDVKIVSIKREPRLTRATMTVRFRAKRERLHGSTREVIQGWVRYDASDEMAAYKEFVARMRQHGGTLTEGEDGQD
jgi:hypothetical protein